MLVVIGTASLGVVGLPKNLPRKERIENIIRQCLLTACRNTKTHRKPQFTTKPLFEEHAC
jgi:hypothetical protein